MITGKRKKYLSPSCTTNRTVKTFIQRGVIDGVTHSAKEVNPRKQTGVAQAANEWVHVYPISLQFSGVTHPEGM